MSVLSTAQQEAVSPHISGSEEVTAARAGDNRLLVVTDRQVLSVKEGKSYGRDVRNISSTLFTDNVAGVDVTHRGSMPVDRGQVYGGGFLLCVGIILGVGSMGFDGLMSTIAVLGAVVSFLVAAYMIYDAYQTPDGEVRVTIRMVGETPDVDYWLPEDEADVAAEISRAAGEALVR